jgi:hypothetical protein
MPITAGWWFQVDTDTFIHIENKTYLFSPDTLLRAVFQHLDPFLAVEGDVRSLMKFVIALPPARKMLLTHCNHLAQFLASVGVTVPLLDFTCKEARSDSIGYLFQWLRECFFAAIALLHGSHFIAETKEDEGGEVRILGMYPAIANPQALPCSSSGTLTPEEPEPRAAENH